MKRCHNPAGYPVTAVLSKSESIGQLRYIEDNDVRTAQEKLEPVEATKVIARGRMPNTQKKCFQSVFWFSFGGL
jgi:hypothetical protein